MKYNPNASTGFAAVDKVEAPDDDHADRPHEAPVPSFHAVVAGQSVDLSAGTYYEGTDPRENERNFKNPIGSGPFMFKEWVRGSHILMERNPNYYKKDHALSRSRGRDASFPNSERARARA